MCRAPDATMPVFDTRYYSWCHFVTLHAAFGFDAAIVSVFQRASWAHACFMLLAPRVFIHAAPLCYAHWRCYLMRERAFLMPAALCWCAPISALLLPLCFHDTPSLFERRQLSRHQPPCHAPCHFLYAVAMRRYFFSLWRPLPRRYADAAETALPRCRHAFRRYARHCHDRLRALAHAVDAYWWCFSSSSYALPCFAAALFTA